jgi:PKD repeat protein
MKQITLSILFLLFFFCLLNAQDIKTDYDIEEQGYFNNSQITNAGIVVTDNYSSALYLISNGNLEKLISAPGVGRYFTISPDKNLIGFKIIEKGKQTPAIYDLNTGKIKNIHKSVNQCGQLSFSNNGDIAFTIGNELIIKNPNKKTSKIDLKTYSNIVSISPDGKYIAYNNKADRIVILELSSGVKTIISEKDKMSAYPKWSPDSKKLMYQSENLFVWDLVNSKLKMLDKALAPKWHPDSKHIIYHKTKITKQKLIDANIFITDLNGNIINITNTENEIEMQPNFIDENTILYHNYDKREIVKLNINNKSREVLYKHEGSFSINYFNIEKSTKAEVRIPGLAPYVHQVYDTPNWHYGYGSCAPTTSIMAIAYYNLLPKWPEEVSSPYSHTSDYGSYVADKYTLNEIYYDTPDVTGGGETAWGGYGYMWGNGSPNSYMRQYHENHYLTSNQLWNSSCTFSYTTAEIDTGYPHPLCVMLTASGHLILTIGYVVGQHTLIFNDPYGNKNTSGWPSYDGVDSYYDWPGYNHGYQNLDYNGTYGGIAWSVKSRGQEVLYNDTLIDDVFYNHGFNMNNSLNTSHMKYFHDVNTGYNNHLWYTITMATLSDICWVTWVPNLTNTGKYEVSAYIPSTNADATGAIYHIRHAYGDSIVVVDQSAYSDEWVSLGSFNFDAGQSSNVYLGDSTGLDGQQIVFDAVKWSYLPIPTINYNADITSICEGNSVQYINSTQNAISYQWYFEGGTPSTSSMENPIVQYDSSGIYSVTLIAVGTGGNDTLEYVNYITVNSYPVANFNAIDTVLYLPSAIAIFSNTSQEANSYTWNFGNGNTSSDVNPYNIYNTAGFYTVSLIAENGLCDNDTLVLSDYIHVYNGVGIDEISQLGIEIYPNPSSGKIKVQAEGIERIEIMDIQGKQIYTGKENEVDLSTQPKGIYIIKVTNNKGVAVEKIVLE